MQIRLLPCLPFFPPIIKGRIMKNAHEHLTPFGKLLLRFGPHDDDFFDSTTPNSFAVVIVAGGVFLFVGAIIGGVNIKLLSSPFIEAFSMGLAIGGFVGAIVSIVTPIIVLLLELLINFLTADRLKVNLLNKALGDLDQFNSKSRYLSELQKILMTMHLGFFLLVTVMAWIGTMLFMTPLTTIGLIVLIMAILGFRKGFALWYDFNKEVQEKTKED